MMQSTIGNIREAFERGEGAGLSTIIALAHFDIAERALGRGWEALPLDSVAFEDRFPEQPGESDPLINKFTGLRMYQNWRSATLRMIFANGGAPTEDHIQSLVTYGRIAGLKSGLSDIRKPLERAFGKETPPAAITRELAVEADRQLTGIDRQRLRKALKCVDNLRTLPNVIESGLLGPELIGPMPRYRASGQREVPLPPKLGDWCDGLSAGLASPLKLVFEIGVDAGILREGEDIPPGRLVEPATFSALHAEVHARHKPRTAEHYLKMVRCAILGTCVVPWGRHRRRGRPPLRDEPLPTWHRKRR